MSNRIGNDDANDPSARQDNEQQWCSKMEHCVLANGHAESCVIVTPELKGAEREAFRRMYHAGEVEGDSLVGTASRSNGRQVGGAHYGLSEYQHWDMVIEFGLDYFQGQITKYVMRWDKKNGVQDLEKAKHFLEKYIDEINAGNIVRGAKRGER